MASKTNPEDFGYGGAFPELHCAQYPLGMGSRSTNPEPGQKTLPVTVDKHGNSIVRHDENSSKTVYSHHSNLVAKIFKNVEEEEDDVEDLRKEIEEMMLQTKAEIEKIVNGRLIASQPTHSSDSNFIKYKPSQQSSAFNSGANQRIICMVETAVDPIEPPKFKHKGVPKPSGSPPVPVLHSPPRPVTVQDQQDWKIPPCVSNWKNPKGYTIQLEKRLAADGRVLEEVQINDNFAKLSEALYVSEHKAREAVAMRSIIQKEMMKDKERKEQELRALAHKASSTRTNEPSIPVMPSDVMDEDSDFPREEKEEYLNREKIHGERKRERRLEAKDAAMGKRSKITRDRDRDISEKVAIGMASTCGIIMYDQRLFNQEKGMDSGFATDEHYNVYDKGFTGASQKSGPRDKEAEEADPNSFFLDQFIREMNTGKMAMEKVGSGGTMSASAGSSMGYGYEGGGSGGSGVAFKKGR